MRIVAKAVKAKTKGGAEKTVGSLRIVDAIGGEGASAKGVMDSLEELRGKGASDLVVSVHSPGGDAFAGLAIHDAIRSWDKGERVVRVRGLAASAASIVAMAGDRIVMSPNSMMMIHGPKAQVGGLFGSALSEDDVQKLAAKMKACRETMVAIYAKRTGKRAEDVEELVRAETWFKAKDAVKAGFADEIEDPDEDEEEDEDEDVEAADRFRLVAEACWQNAPAEARALLAFDPDQPRDEKGRWSGDTGNAAKDSDKAHQASQAAGKSGSKADHEEAAHQHSQAYKSHRRAAVEAARAGDDKLARDHESRAYQHRDSASHHEGRAGLEPRSDKEAAREDREHEARMADARSGRGGAGPKDWSKASKQEREDEALKRGREYDSRFRDAHFAAAKAGRSDDPADHRNAAEAHGKAADAAKSALEVERDRDVRDRLSQEEKHHREQEAHHTSKVDEARERFVREGMKYLKDKSSRTGGTKAEDEAPVFDVPTFTAFDPDQPRDSDGRWSGEGGGSGGGRKGGSVEKYRKSLHERIPSWNKSDLDEIKKKAAELKDDEVYGKGRSAEKLTPKDRQEYLDEARGEADAWRDAARKAGQREDEDERKKQEAGQHLWEAKALKIERDIKRIDKAEPKETHAPRED